MRRTAFSLWGTAATAALAIGLTATPAAWAQQARYQFDIPAQNLDSALKQFGKVTRMQIVYDGRKARAYRSLAVQGNLTALEALNRLLGNTGFSVRTGRSGVLIVEGGAQSGARSGNAHADDRDDGQDPEKGIADILVVGSKSQNADVRRTKDDAQPYVIFDQQQIQRSQAVNLEDFLRTRLPSNAQQGTEAQRTSQNPADGPGSTRSSINLRGLGTNQTLILVDGRPLADLSIQNPQGLGLTGSGQPDINGIPLASVERIEVLPSTAGGIYGGNAVGGVVNIILRHDYRGLELTANYQDTADFKYPNGRLDVTGGLSLEGGKTNITFGGSISRTGVLRVGDRPFSQRGFDLGLKNAPEQFIPDGTNVVPAAPARGTNFFRTGPTCARFPNPAFCSTAPLTFKAIYGGGSYGNYFGTVPVGFTGTTAQLADVLRAGGSGTYNEEQPLGNAGARRALLSAPEVQSFNVNFRRRVTDAFDIFADYSNFINKGNSRASTGGAPTSAVLSPTAPNNPFNESIQVNFDDVLLATPYSSRSKTERGTLGFNLRLPHRWAIGFDHTVNWAETREDYSRSGLDDVSTECALLGISPGNVGTTPGTCRTVGAVPGDPRPIIDVLTSPDYTPYLLNRGPTTHTRLATIAITPTLRLSGPLFGLPAGPVNFTGYVQRNTAKSRLGSRIDDFYPVATASTPDFTRYSAFAPNLQRRTSEYGELRIPLFSSRNAQPLLRELSLQLSVRHDAYKTQAYVNSFATATRDYGGATANNSFQTAIDLIGDETQSANNQTTNYTAAVEYRPIRDVLLRGSYGTGYLQPTVAQLVTVSQVGNFGVEDPLRNDTQQEEDYVILQGGGGFHFQPERSRSLSAGVVVEPRFVPGSLRLSADYTRITKRGEITGINIFDLIQFPERFPGRLVRAPLTAEDAALGYTGGLITSYDTTIINLLRSKVETLDVQADYNFGLGKFGEIHAYALGTYAISFRRQPTAGEPYFNSVGYIDGPLRGRANGGFDWVRGNLTITYNAQWYSSYKIYSQSINDSPESRDAMIALQGSDHIPSQMYHDLYATYQIPASSGILKGVRVAFGVQNVFNKYPPTVASIRYSQSGYSGYGDPRLRRFTLTLRKSFAN